ncbi:siroheme synthase CysG [Motilimonas eburnea]|uniref:siroheme synthase CysG n=1 Tax=Motilimonas eburnea TaxID=1737488 RepID=UPI001E4922CE|nr:siroheme synthase CysG [Motilimonas eburnea]MCE2570831.1 siroheme synthase CysG [Motilimonas eburnea]
MDYLPIFTKLEQRLCLVIGGGSVALRKVRYLLKAKANVVVHSSEFCVELSAIKDPNLTLIRQAYSSESLIGAWLVIAATNDAKVNLQVANDANEKGIFANVVDVPEAGSFILPSVVDRSPIVVAVSSGGNTPVLARLIRAKLEALLPNYLGPLARLAGEFRAKVQQALPTVEGRRRYWEHIFNTGAVAGLLEKGKQQQARELMNEQLADFNVKGEVALVGAGPGDPSLITLKALQLMQQADVVLYDQLVSQETLALVRRDAQLVNVGKEAGRHSVIQETTNELLVKYAQQGNKVVRLKGGDPFIFGRGGEELEVLVEHGIDFQVVPGVTAASGCASYAGIPLTHRDYAQSVTFVTGHCKEQGEPIDWSSLAREHQTTVFYMGLLQAEKIYQNLTLNGRSPATPVAIVSKGTRADQNVTTGQLEQLPEMAKTVQPPALIIVGEVVSLADKLNWFGEQSSQTDAQSLVNLA